MPRKVLRVLQYLFTVRGTTDDLCSDIRGCNNGAWFVSKVACRDAGEKVAVLRLDRRVGE